MAIIYLLFSLTSWGRPLVLLGHFDPFDKAPFNNSEKVAKLLLEKTKNHPAFELKLCALQTVFDKSFFQLEDCLRSLATFPKLILGLGESACNMKLESMARNLDKTKGPDNDGIERNNLVIIPSAPSEIGFTYPLEQMYCSLGIKQRNEIDVSNNAGSFVCNNLAFQFSYNYEDLSFGFIHVPGHNCRNLEVKNINAVKNLELMITAALKNTEVKRLKTKKKDLEVLRLTSKEDPCLEEFYRRTKGIDEKNFWQL